MWIYFLKEAPSLQMIPDKMGEIPAIDHALNIANQANLSEKELDELHHQEVFLMDQLGYVIKGREEGLQQGLEQGLQQGLEQGLQQGLQQGKVSLVLGLIQRKLGEIPESLKTSLQNLSAQRLDELSLKIFDFNCIDDLENFLS